MSAVSGQRLAFDLRITPAIIGFFDDEKKYQKNEKSVHPPILRCKKPTGGRPN
jgi:hypothetical protein